MQPEEVFKCGSLSTPPQGFLKKSWQRRYFALYRASRQGIQRLEVFDTEEQFHKQNSTKIIALADCLKVAAAPQKQQANVFEIRTKDSVHLFSADTFQEMTDWLNRLQLVAFGGHANGSCSGTTTASGPNSNISNNSNSNNGNKLNNSHNNQFTEPPTIANHFSSHLMNNNAVNNTNGVIGFNNQLMHSLGMQQQNEENLLYCSVDAPDVYTVKLLETEASVRCGLNCHSDRYSVVITPVSISLAEDARMLFTWPYRHIRRYGCTKDGFSLEAGRKCASGDGLFSFITLDGNLIFQSVAGHVNSLKASRSLTDDFLLNNAMNNNNNCQSNSSPPTGPVPVGTSSTDGHHQLGPNINNINGNIKNANETLPTQTHFYFNNDTRPMPSVPTSEPRSNSSSPASPPKTPVKSGSIGSGSSGSSSLANVSLNKPPEPTKRHSMHSIVKSGSPVAIQKAILTRVTSSSAQSTTSISISTSGLTDTNSLTRPSPPISKPPRKSKEKSPTATTASTVSTLASEAGDSKSNSNTLDRDEEPVFVSREEIFGLPPEINHYETAGSGVNHDNNDDKEAGELLYDEPSEYIASASSASSSSGRINIVTSITKTDQSTDQMMKPPPPSGERPSAVAVSTSTPVTQTVSKLTSVLKMMFAGNLSQQVHQPKMAKDKDKRQSTTNTHTATSAQHSRSTSCSSSSSSPTGSTSSPIPGSGLSASASRSPTNHAVQSPLEKSDGPIDTIAFARVCLVDVPMPREAKETSANNINDNEKHQHQQHQKAAGASKSIEFNQRIGKTVNSISKQSAGDQYSSHGYANVSVVPRSEAKSIITINNNNNNTTRPPLKASASPEHYVQNECEYAKVYKRLNHH